MILLNGVGRTGASICAPVAQLVSPPGELAGHASGRQWPPAAAASLPLSVPAGTEPSHRRQQVREGRLPHRTEQQ